jgi:hypothetical protein
MRELWILVAGVCAGFGVGLLAGPRTARSGDAEGDVRTPTTAQLARALERLEQRLGAPAPVLEATPAPSRNDAGEARIAELLVGITERLDRLERAQGTSPAPLTPRERTAEQSTLLDALAQGEPESTRKEHFMWTTTDVLERYGVPDHAHYWSGATIRWVYRLGADDAPGRGRAVFELLHGHVTGAFVEREP